MQFIQYFIEPRFLMEHRASLKHVTGDIMSKWRKSVSVSIFRLASEEKLN